MFSFRSRCCICGHLLVAWILRISSRQLLINVQLQLGESQDSSQICHLNVEICSRIWSGRRTDRQNTVAGVLLPGNNSSCANQMQAPLLGWMSTGSSPKIKGQLFWFFYSAEKKGCKSEKNTITVIITFKVSVSRPCLILLLISKSVSQNTHSHQYSELWTAF